MNLKDVKCGTLARSVDRCLIPKVTARIAVRTMDCDNCGTEFDGPVLYRECPECGAELDMNINYKPPVEDADNE